MLRHVIDTRSINGSVDLSTPAGSSIAALFVFIDRNISGFRSFYMKYGDSNKENRISDGLVVYLTRCLNVDFEGFAPYHFSKNPTQAHSSKETDIGVRVPLNANPLATIAEFEAKRLSDTSANTEYVYGIRGGIERFKRLYHAKHLKVCGMLGYEQSKTVDEWPVLINGWIKDMADLNDDDTIDWRSEVEKLSQLEEERNIYKWRSQNLREGGSSISIYHYFIDLC